MFVLCNHTYDDKTKVDELGEREKRWTRPNCCQVMDDQTEARRLEKSNLTSTPKTREHFTDWRMRCDTSAMLSVDSLSLRTQENPLSVSCANRRMK